MSQAQPSVASLIVTYVLLLVLLVATVAVAQIELGVLAMPVALAIACTKALLIIVYFMHLKDSISLVWLTAAIGFVWLVHMIAGTFGDYLTRGWSLFS